LRAVRARRENSHTGNMCPHRSAIARAPVRRPAPAGRMAGSRPAAMTAGCGHRGHRSAPAPYGRRSPPPEATIRFRPRSAREVEAVPVPTPTGAGGGGRGDRTASAGRDGAGARDAPARGNVDVVVRAHRAPGFRREKDRNAPCASVGTSRPVARTAPTRCGVRVATYRLSANCEASPQISAPALVRTHQRQLTGTCKIFGMPRNRNTEAPRLVVIT
jgi:hypothetical protein